MRGVPSPQSHLPFEGTLTLPERDVMEFWLDKSRVAYTTQPKGIASVTLDVWEQSSLVSLPFKFTASFISEIDARVYLTAKFLMRRKRQSSRRSPTPTKKLVPA